MPTMSNYFNYIMINLAFIAQILIMVYFRSALDIKQNWPLYRCNPPYWIFSDNIADDFSYCVQNTQIKSMGFLLQPITYLISNLTSYSFEFSDSINNIRKMLSGIRGAVSSIIQNVFGVFLNLITEFQKMIMSIKDMVGKMLGIVVTILYVLDGSVKTMQSTWNGPPGKLVKAIGACFHPNTKIKTQNGTIFDMKDIPLGSILEDGSKVFAVLKIDNANKESLYKINGSVNGEPIYVTGLHFIQKNKTEPNEFIQIKDCKYAILQQEVYSDWFSCLITSNRRIKIGEHIFWDWEDDELTKQ